MRSGNLMLVFTLILTGCGQQQAAEPAQAPGQRWYTSVQVERGGSAVQPELCGMPWERGTGAVGRLEAALA